MVALNFGQNGKKTGSIVALNFGQKPLKSALKTTQYAGGSLRDLKYYSTSSKSE